MSLGHSYSDFKKGNCTDKTITLEELIFSIRTDQELKKKVHNIRKARTDRHKRKIKESLPRVRTAGVVDKEGDVITPSGLVQIDIDRKENPRLNDAKTMHALKQELYDTDECIVAAFESPSGGIKAIAQIPETNDAKEYRAYAESLFSVIAVKTGLTVDHCGAEIGRLCYASSDSRIIVRQNPTRWENKMEADENEGSVDDLSLLSAPDEYITIKAAKAMLERIDADMPYNDWLRVAGALRHQFQSKTETLEAYELFDEWSSKGTKYDSREATNKLFFGLKPQGNGKTAPVTIGTLIKMAKEAGWQNEADTDQIYWLGDRIGVNLPEPPPVLVEGVLRRKSKMLIAGPSKARKTYTALDLAIAVGLGTTWLGQKCHQGTVLYLDFELSEYDFPNRGEKIYHQHREEYGIRTVPPVHYMQLRGTRFNLGKIIKKIKRFCLKHDVVLVIIDPLYACLNGMDENDNSKIAGLMFDFEQLAQETEAAVAIVHHFAKGSAENKAVIDRMSGAGAFARAPDSLLTLTPHKEDSRDNPVINADFIVRSFEPIPTRVLRLNGSRWYVDTETPPSATEKKPGRPSTYNPEMLVNIVGDRKMTRQELETEIDEQLGMSKPTFRKHLNAAIDQNLLLKMNDGRYITLDLV